MIITAVAVGTRGDVEPLAELGEEMLRRGHEFRILTSEAFRPFMNGFRGIDYTRTKSVAEGDDCCDYRLRDSRNKKMTGAEKRMAKKGTIKAELDRQTQRSDALWQKATARLNEIQDKYGAFLFEYRSLSHL